MASIATTTTATTATRSLDAAIQAEYRLLRAFEHNYFRY